MKCFFSSEEIFTVSNGNISSPQTGVLKITVITTNISLPIFLLWRGNYRSEIFPHQRRKVRSPARPERGAEPGRDNIFVRIQDSVVVELKIGAKQFAPSVTLHRSEKFPFSSGNYLSKIFPYLCGFHSYISLLVWKLFIPFGSV